MIAQSQISIPTEEVTLSRRNRTRDAGGSGGFTFDICMKGESIVSMEVSESAGVVCAIAFQFTNGMVKQLGEKKGNSTVIYFNDEQWCENIFITRGYVDCYDVIVGMRIITNKQTYMLGRIGENDIEIVGKGYLAGVYGASGGLIDRLGFYVDELPVYAVISGLEYDFPNAKNISQGEKVLGVFKHNNQDLVEKTVHFKGAENVNEMGIWSSNVKTKVNIDTTLQVALPFIEKGLLQCGAEKECQIKWGGEHRVSVNHQWECTISVAPKSNINTKALLKESILEIPYTAMCEVEYSDGKSKNHSITGTFRGVLFHDFEVKIASGNGKVIGKIKYQTTQQ